MILVRTHEPNESLKDYVDVLQIVTWINDCRMSDVDSGDKMLIPGANKC